MKNVKLKIKNWDKARVDARPTVAFGIFNFAFLIFN